MVPCSSDPRSLDLQQAPMDRSRKSGHCSTADLAPDLWVGPLVRQGVPRCVRQVGLVEGNPLVRVGDSGSATVVVRLLKLKG